MNVGILLILLTAGSVQASATTTATPLPEMALHGFGGTILICVLVLAVLGFIGLLTASADKVDLHYGMGDVYLSVPIALACWTSLAGMGVMGYRGDDLLPYLQEKLCLSCGLLVLSLLLSFILVRRCNPQAGLLGVTIAAFGRLFVDTISQLLSILVVLSGVWVIFGGKEKKGEGTSLLGRLGCAFAFIWMFNVVWGTIRTTTRQQVSSANGYLLGTLNVICIAGAAYGGYVYTHREPQLPSSELVAAVSAGSTEQALRLIAQNPMMNRTPAIEIALREGDKAMLNCIVRDWEDLDIAITHAETHGLHDMLRFLKEKKSCSGLAANE